MLIGSIFRGSHMCWSRRRRCAALLALRSKLVLATAVEQIPDALSHPLIVHAGSSLQYVSDYQTTLSRLVDLKPELFVVSQTPVTSGHTYARLVLNTPHRKIASWVFSRAEFIARLEELGYCLLFSVDHDLPLTHNNAPEPSIMASTIFSPALPQFN